LYAIENTEVDLFCLAPHVGGDVGGVENNLCRGAVDVFAVAERFNEFRVAGDFGCYAKLNLGVVGREQHVPGVGWDEGFADFPAERGADGNVLQVRI